MSEAFPSQEQGVDPVGIVEDGARVHLLAWMDLARSNLAPWPEVRRLHSNLLARTEKFIEATSDPLRDAGLPGLDREEGTDR